MYPLGSLLISIAKILNVILTIYQYLILGVVIVSWVGADPYNPIVRFLRQITEPVFAPVRRILPRALFRTRLDFTPLVVFLLIYFFQIYFIPLLVHYGQKIAGPG
ncbi:MAG TPA: hypothetical protein DF383_12560 [Deltaproteobacteria bacterium]|nr:hypothetical protein [Deltaproteobacteria bacterium]